MNEVDIDIPDIKKVKRRKSRRERNRIRDNPVREETTIKSKFKHLQQSKSGKKGLSSRRNLVRKDTAVLGNTRLTRKLGIFGQVKTSATVVKEPLVISESVEQETNAELNKILNNSDTLFPVTCVDTEETNSVLEKNKMSVNRDLGANKNDTCAHGGYGFYMTESNVQVNPTKKARNHTQKLEYGSSYKSRFHNVGIPSSNSSLSEKSDIAMETEDIARALISSQDLPPSPNVAEIASTLTTNLCVKQMFPGRDMLKRTKHELYNMIKQNSPALEIGSRSAGQDYSTNKTPIHAKVNPTSFRGSCSSETVRRSPEKSVNMMDHQTSLAKSAEHLRTYDNFPDDEFKQHTVFSCAKVKYPSNAEQVRTEDHDNQLDVEGSFFHVDALTDARVLIDYNEKIGKMKKSLKKYEVKRYSDTNSYSCVNPAFVHDRRTSRVSYPPSLKVQHNDDTSQHYRHKKLHYMQSALELFQNPRSSVVPLESSTKAGGDNVKIVDSCCGTVKPTHLNNDFIDHNSKETALFSGYDCDKGKHYPLQRKNKYYNDGEFSTYRHRSGNFHSSSRDYIEIDMSETDECKMDILDYLDHECKPSHSVLCHRDKYLTTKKGSKSRLCRGTPDSDGSPSWYASFKPEPFRESPEKMFPRRL